MKEICTAGDQTATPHSPGGWCPAERAGVCHDCPYHTHAFKAAVAPWPKAGRRNEMTEILCPQCSKRMPCQPFLANPIQATQACRECGTYRVFFEKRWLWMKPFKLEAVLPEVAVEEKTARSPEPEMDKGYVKLPDVSEVVGWLKEEIMKVENIIIIDPWMALMGLGFLFLGSSIKPRTVIRQIENTPSPRQAKLVKVRKPR